MLSLGLIITHYWLTALLSHFRNVLRLMRLSTLERGGNVGTGAVPSPAWMPGSVSFNPFGWFFPHSPAVSLPTFTDQSSAEDLTETLCRPLEFCLWASPSSLVLSLVNSSCLVYSRLSTSGPPGSSFLCCGLKMSLSNNLGAVAWLTSFVSCFSGFTVFQCLMLASWKSCILSVFWFFQVRGLICSLLLLDQKLKSWALGLTFNCLFIRDTTSLDLWVRTLIWVGGSRLVWLASLIFTSKVHLVDYINM